MQEERGSGQLNNESESWHPTLPVYGDQAKTAGTKEESPAAGEPAEMENEGPAAGESAETKEAVPAEGEPAGTKEAVPAAGESAETKNAGPSSGNSAGTKEAGPAAGNPAAGRTSAAGSAPAADDWGDLSGRIIQQSAKEIREDAPTEEELRRRKQRDAQRRERIEQARKREEKRYRRTRVELNIIIGILLAAIVVCGVLLYILATQPQMVATIRENLPTWEKIVETVNETAEIIEEAAADGTQEEAAEEEEAALEGVTYVGTFELPIEGATGYSPVAMSVTDDDGNKVGSLSAGEAFVILDTDGDYFHIELSDGTTGRVSTSCTWINLPDVIPSIIYYDVNADSSIFKSSGYNLPGITGEQLYTSKYMNERLGEEEYCMPVLYSMAVKIMQIQQACLKNGQSLKIYQTFRPYETQMAVASALQSLESSNSEVYAGLNSGSWSDTWFIATKLSNHQRGCAIDVTLVQVDATEQRLCAGYLYTVVSEYTEYAMPSDMHELSYRAAVFDPPVSGSSETAWLTAQYADTMTTYAYQLQDYCTTYGLTPLSSEWWHFNDLEAKSAAGSSIGTGNFYLTECLSREPSEAQETQESSG